MSNLAGGNVLGGLDSASRNGLSIPGYQFCRAVGYIALKSTPYNRFPLVEPTGRKDGIDRLLTIPRGARIYSVGVRTGRGFFNRLSGHNLHLTAVDPQGVLMPSVSQTLGIMSNSDAIAPLDVSPSSRRDNLVFSLPEPSDTYIQTIPPFSDGGEPPTPILPFKAINDYISQFPQNGIPPEYAKSNPGPSFEIQCRVGPMANDLIADPLTGGLKQNDGAAYKNQGYAIVEIAYIVRDWSISTSENLNVAWDEVFKYVF